MTFLRHQGMFRRMTNVNTVETLPWTLGWRIRRSLEHAGIDIQDLAVMLEVSRSTVSRWLHDDGLPKQLYLREIARICGVSYEWLADQPPPPPRRGPGGRARTLRNTVAETVDSTKDNQVIAFAAA